jgi:hypothetical protein
MELLDVCLTTVYFKLEDKFYQQEEGMAMGKSLVVSNILCNTFEKIALHKPGYKPAKWLIYVDDMFVD